MNQDKNNESFRDQFHKRWVYGTKSEKWYLVDPSDRDYLFGISQIDMAKYGKEVCKEKYLKTQIFN